MSINKDIVTLREKTGSGILECKHALVEADNDLEKATEILRKKGIAQAVKKGARTTKDGLVSVRVENNGKSAVMLRLDCETDFVARTPDFIKLTDAITDRLVSAKEAQDIATIPAELNGLVVESIGRLRENIKLSRFIRFNVQADTNTVVSYVHPGNKLGVLLEVKLDNPLAAGNQEIMNFLKDLAMQIAAMNPTWVKSSDVPGAVIEKEKEIYKQQEKSSGKPDKILEQIAMGKLKKFYGQACLVDQEFIKDPKVTIAKMIDVKKANTGFSLEPVRFARFKVGEE